MVQSYEFLVARANEAAKEAEGASLENVRQRARRSEAVWREMADRALNMAQEREKARLDKERGNASENTG